MRLCEIKETVFYTSKGSRYTVHSDGTTTRFKSYHPEHGHEDQGQQPRSEYTFYASWDELVEKLSSFQAEGGGVKRLLPIIGYPQYQGYYGIKYETGSYAGKWDKNSIIKPETEPAIGLCPVEIFRNGHFVHFGNKIVKIET